MIGCPLENHPGHKNRDTPWQFWLLHLLRLLNVPGNQFSYFLSKLSIFLNNFLSYQEGSLKF